MFWKWTVHSLATVVTIFQFCIQCQALGAAIKISELESFKNIDIAELLKNGESTWFIFDCDNTLLKPKDTFIGSHQWGDRIRDQLIETKHLSFEKANDIKDQKIDEVQPFVSVMPTEPYTAEFVHKLQKNLNIVTFALTARLERSRAASLRQLKDLDISFAGHSPKNDLLQDLLPDGIAIAGARSKGDLLRELYEQASNKPTHIIMFDDRKYNLEAIEKAIRDLNLTLDSPKQVNFTGFRYSATDLNFAELKNPKNAEIADLQYRLFLKTRVIVPNSTLTRDLESH